MAGESLDRELEQQWLDDWVQPYLIAMLLWVLAFVEWWRVLHETPPAPWLYTVIALAGTAWAGWRFHRGKIRRHQLKLGRAGERAVAQYLEWFRTKDFFVFHDVPNGDANIDHVLIGTRGLYVIETKTLSKPVRGECKIVVSADGIRANGRLLDRNPIVQAKAQARWLYDFLGESRFKPFVRPVVVFPGWFVERFDMKARGVWVLEPKALDAFIEQEPEVLTHDQMRAMASAPSSYIRSKSAL